MTYSDPSGEWVLQVALALTAIYGTVAAISGLVYRGAYEGDDIVEITTHPVILHNSGWSYGSAATVITEAARIWKAVAGIKVTPAAPIPLDDNVINSDSKTEIGYQYVELKSGTSTQEERDEARDRLDAALDRLPKGKHLTTFIGTLMGSRGFGIYNDVESSHHGRGFAFVVYGGGAGRTCAHEWGHTFGLEHPIIPYGLPFALMTSTLGWGEGLSDAQIEKARDGARNYQ